MTIGTSAASASRNSSASRAVFRDRAEVAATSRDTWANRASSMQPWCTGKGGTTHRSARCPRGGIPRRDPDDTPLGDPWVY
ncbi:hypothetical protein GCM10023323_12100 [Streptomyces thinghirensis]|uniref:Uncharacterized protein n=1 Tax=Streptomyces thinghirensis TaxID=551547 RepID=A0ABP9SZ23_9ACTN